MKTAVPDCWQSYGIDYIWFCEGFQCVECGVQAPAYAVEDREDQRDMHRPDCSYATDKPEVLE